MKNIILITVFFIGISDSLQSQTPQTASVEIEAIIQTNPPKITLGWKQVEGSTQYQIFRKNQSSNDWGTSIAILNGSEVSFEDNNVIVNTLYEYKIIRNYNGIYQAYGYVTSGINMDPIANRGIIILVIDNTYTTSLATQIKRLSNDLEGEGWLVRRFNVSPTASVTSVKAAIKSRYNASPDLTKAVFLIGHVPVPYSGYIAPDGHPDHGGAWSADLYYADMDGVWTDNSVNNPNAPNFRNVNIPGDGKFDQSSVPFNQAITNDDLELQIGRVDMHDLPLFANTTELDLLKNYFDRNHQYRTKLSTYENRALIDDNFGYFGGESFASTGWRSFPPLVGSANVTETDYFTALNSESYLWSYGCGGGSWYGAEGDYIGGVGTTSNMVSSNIKTAFTLLFGSYIGDWDHTNSIMKGSLASGALTCAWAGRPAWMFHDMGMDGTIGYSTQLTQNNNSQLYSSSYVGTGMVHIALLGDPTLRNKVIVPPSNFTSNYSSTGVNLNWTASTESGIAGYNIYIFNSSSKSYSKINSEIITGTSFSHCSQSQINNYYIRAVKLVTTPSGSYYLESTGIKKRINTSRNLSFQVITEDQKISIINNSITKNPNYAYLWEYSDGTSDVGFNPNPKIFTTYGNQSVTLKLYNECTIDSLTQFFTLMPPTPGFLSSNLIVNTNVLFEDVKISNNPSNNGYFDVLIKNNIENLSYEVYDALGKSIKIGNLNATDINSIDLSNQPNGMYFVKIISISKTQKTYKLINQKGQF